ncbi:MAG: hypothetical protein ACRDRL_00520 [Sciscionella sp.]
MSIDSAHTTNTAPSGKGGEAGVPAQRDARGYQMGLGRENQPDERTRAVRFLASRAHDAAELTELLDILGLDAADGRR